MTADAQETHKESLHEHLQRPNSAKTPATAGAVNPKDSTPDRRAPNPEPISGSRRTPRTTDLASLNKPTQYLRVLSPGPKSGSVSAPVATGSVYFDKPSPYRRASSPRPIGRNGQTQSCQSPPSNNESFIDKLTAVPPSSTPATPRGESIQHTEHTPTKTHVEQIQSELKKADDTPTKILVDAKKIEIDEIQKQQANDEGAQGAVEEQKADEAPAKTYTYDFRQMILGKFGHRRFASKPESFDSMGKRFDLKLKPSVIYRNQAMPYGLIKPYRMILNLIKDDPSSGELVYAYMQATLQPAVTKLYTIQSISGR